MNVEEQTALCYYARTGQCREKATVTIMCSVEGTEAHFCQFHWNTWKAISMGDEGLSKRCPRCAPAYQARRENQAMNPSTEIADEPITGPLADAIDRAMHSEGILGPERRRVLRRLAANTDAYVAALVSRNSGAVV